MRAGRDDALSEPLAGGARASRAAVAARPSDSARPRPSYSARPRGLPSPARPVDDPPSAPRAGRHRPAGRGREPAAPPGGSGFFAALGRVALRRRRWILAGAAGLVVAAVLWGTAVFGSLSSGGFDDPGSDSARAEALAASRFGPPGDDVVVLYESPDGTVDDVAFRRAVETHLAGLPAEIRGSATYWSTGSPAFVSDDRRATYAALQLEGTDDDERTAAYGEVAEALRGPVPRLDVSVGGKAAVFSDVTTQTQHDIERAGMISMPVTMVLLVVIFGGLVAAGLPLLVGGLAVLGAFMMLRLLTLVTDVSVFSINVVLLLGLGLSIDYALFIVSRFREELRGGSDVPDALVRTMTTAGRTVAFSGLTVAISLASLLLFPQVSLRSMGFGGMAAVLVAMVSALTVLPAMLAVLGHRVDALRLWRRPSGGGRHSSRAVAGAWHQLASSVIRRPLLYVGVIVPVLLLFGSPVLGVVFGGVDHRVLPDDTTSRTVAERLAAEFPGGTEPLEVIAVHGGDVAARPALDGYVADLADLPGVTAAEVDAVGGDAARILVDHDQDPQSAAARELVADVRAVTAPPGTEVLVGGVSAELADLLASIGRTLPWMAAAIVAVSLVLLFLAFGSVVLPVKAVLMNALSLTASFGAIVWIFQDGNLAGPLGVSVTGTIDATQPLLMLAVVFGLSMDYEIFLLSRVREQWDRTGDNAESVAVGLQHTGRIITSAALLMVVVIGAFSTSGITFIKMIGIGLIIAIIIDATIVRALLVPASMALLGRANWWAPAPLARFWRRYGFRKGDEPLGADASAASSASSAGAPAVPAAASPVPAGRRS